jgi:hypothetical protein
MALRKALLRLLLPPLLALLALLGIIVAGRSARDWLRQQDRYTFAIADIECAPPPGQDRAAFLGEVQYVASLPERLPLLDDDLSQRLKTAFARHPWVEKVRDVTITPPSRVRVQLVHRTPVLAVQVHGSAKDVRAVDRDGILLPTTAPLVGLFQLHGNIPAPAGAAGTAWGQATVEAAARTADVLRPHQQQLRLEVIEITDGNIILSTPPQVRVLWGHAPGAEAIDEVPAAQKLERLLSYCQEHGQLSNPPFSEHDVRPKDQARHRIVPHE